ncbi:hypothetical protein SPRG_10045 [Saprolegnia parasitica CBS 223.65]|uniref:Uncharacterized protein n=1 Tax=Saprolegnia parasitica (strain CBS 223.65) TaxID=695850 RepID=A0A067C431_SAPPC|nr:hypothetical protein SPRG_10045 [Saprolegnia parasitica CBS 223.65]KDO23900.1 hypothetical protein SPRG_10045 [Saprolegnia parasitica CBS 223.65]|eukprot:XP_012205369.1 hypothetical protein SPRG_10045 [Saprolegnia parasitica CBS 223.65]
MLRKLALISAVMAVLAPPALAVGCLEDLYICPNGQGVGRDPANNCKFFPCRDAEARPHTPAPVIAPTATPVPVAAPLPSAVGTSAAPTSAPSNMTVHKGIRAGVDHGSNWTAIDASMPHALSQLLNASFDNYHNACAPLNVTVTAAEKAPANDSTALYHLAMDVNCSGTDHVFVLEVTQDAEGLYLSQCGHRENGTTRNWLTIENQVTKCQTPAQRSTFLNQPFNHVTHDAAETSLMQNMQAFLKAPNVPVLGAAVIAVIAVLAFAVFVVHRTRRRETNDRSVLAEVEEAHEEHKRKAAADEDAPAPTTNPLESTTAAPRKASDDLEDGVLSSVKL